MMQEVLGGRQADEEFEEVKGPCSMSESGRSGQSSHAFLPVKMVTRHGKRKSKIGMAEGSMITPHANSDEEF